MEIPGRLQLFAVIAFVLLLRLPFLNQAIQGDDVDYLAQAQHAQIEPLHPNNFRYVFMGTPVDMRGHSHPPGNAWFLAALLAVLGDVREVPFHAAYVVFSLIAAMAMWSLARRFSPHPLWATLLFLAAPPFVVNGTSLESDLPFLAFWMAAVALFVAERYLAAALALALASMAAFQAVFLTPILGLYAWLFQKRARAWVVALTPPLVVAGWQLFEHMTAGALPAAVLTGHFRAYGLQALAAKLRSAAMLAVHACWLIFPLLLPAAIRLHWRRRKPETTFLLGWIAIFFAGAAVVFYAGSARYLLPIAAPIALLVSQVDKKWLKIAFGAQLALSLSLAAVNYEHWDGYRRFAASLPKVQRRIWINGSWGLRFYLEAEGGLPIERNQGVRPGDLVVTSALAYPVEFTTGGGVLAPVAQTEIRPALPLRLIGLESRSGYSTSTKGLLPFGISNGAIDRVKAELVVARAPALSWLPMNAPEATQQIVSGLYRVEDNRWRWTAGRAVILLKAPPQPSPLRAVFYIPDAAPARRIQLFLDGEEIADQTYPGPGTYTLQSRALQPRNPTATLVIAVDCTFSVPGDSRELGIILTEAGFR